jgi:hypothetical protein
VFKLGEAYQFDWSHEDVEIAGKPTTRCQVGRVNSSENGASQRSSRSY